MWILVPLLAFSGTGMVFATAGHAQNTMPRSPEADVYAAALEAVHRGDPDRVVLVSGCARAWGDYGVRGEGLGFFSDLIPGIPAEAVDALVTAPAAELGVTGAQLGPQVHIIPKDLEPSCPQPNLIDRFEAAYPDQPGLFVFSPIGFDASAELALLLVQYWCGPRCGQGTLVLVERTPEGWAVRQSERTWVH